MHLLSEHPGMRESAKFAVGKGCRGSLKYLFSPSILCFCHYAFHQSDAENGKSLAPVFFEQIIGDVATQRHDPAWMLREALQANRESMRKVKDLHRMALCIKSWNAHFSNQQIKMLRWISSGATPEPFPKVAGWSF
jgi:hypothetical protein